MLDGSENGCFGIINNNLDNRMTCGTGSYPRPKDKTAGPFNNYNVSKKTITPSQSRNNLHLNKPTER